MGKASKWLNKLIHLGRRTRRQQPEIKSSSSANNAAAIHGGYGDHNNVDPNRHAIAVAAATAAVAEAALAAAKAAAEVVRLTSNAPLPCEHVSRRWLLLDFAALKIQSAFRGYLARRALRALKALVKLQALVRGHFVRKQSTEMLRRLQAMVRVQNRARASRTQSIDSSNHGEENPTSYECHIKSTTEKLDDPTVKKCGSVSIIREAKGSMSTRLVSDNWLDKWVEFGSSINSPNSMKNSSTQNDKGDKILQVDSWKPKSSKQILVGDNHNRSFAASDILPKYSTHDHHYVGIGTSPCADDIASMKSLQFPLEAYTAESSPPQVYSSESKSGTTRKSAMTPLRNEWSRSFWKNGSPSPSYMANTKSSRAKSRSTSVPRKRDEYDEKRGLCKRSLQAYFG